MVETRQAKRKRDSSPNPQPQAAPEQPKKSQQPRQTKLQMQQEIDSLKQQVQQQQQQQTKTKKKDLPKIRKSQLIVPNSTWQWKTLMNTHNVDENATIFHCDPESGSKFHFLEFLQLRSIRV